MTWLCNSCLLRVITPAVGAIPFARFRKDVHACNSDLMVQLMVSCRSAHLLAPMGSVNSFTSARDKAINSLEISSYSESATSSDVDDNSGLRYDFENVRASLAMAECASQFVVFDFSHAPPVESSMPTARAFLGADVSVVWSPLGPVSSVCSDRRGWTPCQGGGVNSGAGMYQSGIPAKPHYQYTT